MFTSAAKSSVFLSTRFFGVVYFGMSGLFHFSFKEKKTKEKNQVIIPIAFGQCGNSILIFEFMTL